MKLEKKISTDPWFTRSINLTRDINSSDSISAYVITSSTKKSLESVITGFEKLQYSRAWTLIGPYGSGKSSFGLFLNALTSSEDILRKNALKKLQNFDEKLFNKTSKIFKNKKICTINISGSYDLLESHLAEAIFQEINKLSINHNLDSDLIKEAKALRNSKEPKASSIIKLLKSLQDQLKKIKFNGLFIVIDELGKFIEFAGATKKDIFLLQELAELSVEGHKVPIFFIGMLHQKLDYYAQNLSLEIKNEWKKIQGRFEEIAFVESTEQMIRILGGAIKNSYSKQDLSKIKAKIKSCVYYFIDSKFFPNLTGKTPSLKLFSDTYPFHPVSSALLPILAQKLGQNERTVFTYLGSNEAFGFKELLQEKESFEFIMPYDIFDYFYTNQSSYINDHIVNKRWIEILNSLDRLGDDELDLIKLLKTIGLVNLVGSFSSLRCTKELLENIFEKTKLSKMLKILEDKSLILYRKFNDEYRVWQGSDFDFESSIRYELDQLHSFDPVTELNNILPPKPILARRYSIKSGTLRYFQSLYVSSGNIEKFINELDTSQPLALIVFEDLDKVSTKKISKIQSTHKNLLIIKVKNNSFIINECKQLKALNNLLETSVFLSSDPIAKAEIISQIDHSKKKIEDELKQIYKSTNSSWFFNKKIITYSNETDLQINLSYILEEIFNKSPSINNELVNKEKISSQGQAARIRLMKDMLNNTEIKNFGYSEEKAPPEKGMYQAILLDHNLISTSDKGIKFIQPSKGSSFEHIYKFIETKLADSEKPVSFSDLSKELKSPPYGIKEGLHPIIFLAFYFANEENVAIYENNLYKPYFNDEAIERLARKSPSFSFNYHSFDGQSKIIKEYSNVLSGDSHEKNVLSIVRKLSKTMSLLPEYTLSTQSAISTEAIKFRSAFLYSKSPLDLLMKDIPMALGFNKNDLKGSKLESFSSSLNRVLSELKGCYVNLLLNQKKNFCLAFDLNPTKDFVELRPVLYDRLIMLEDYAVDTKSIKPFLKKILDKEKLDQDWFESVLSFLVKKHPKKWNDENSTEVEVELKNISDKIKDLSKLKVYENRNKISSAHDLDIYVMRIKKKGFEEKDIITTLSESEKSEYKKFKKDALGILTKYSKETEDQLSLISALVDDILNGNITKKDFIKLVKDDK